MKTRIPYGDTALPLELPSESDVLVLQAAHAHAKDGDQDKIVLDALLAPIESPPLSALAKGKKSAVIICSDHTRPVPSKRIIPHMLAQLRAGNPDLAITLLIATGCHRLTSRDELRAKFGDEVFDSETIIVHDCDDEDNLVNIGTLPSGAPLIINRLAVECDLLLAEGFIEPHFFAGFSGGRKSVLPGICSRKTVLGNHCSDFIKSPFAITGVLQENPIQKDMEAAARMAKLAFIANVIIDENKQVVAAFAGDALRAHEKGCAHLKTLSSIKPQRKGDIIITSNGGAPLDQNLYQTVKGMSTAEAAAADGAVIILCAACADGIGGDDFYEALKNCKDAQGLMDEVLQVPMEETRPDQWQYQILARILIKHTVIMVTDKALEQTVLDMKMLYAQSLEKALDMAKQIKGENARYTVIPDGVSLIIETQ